MDTRPGWQIRNFDIVDTKCCYGKSGTPEQQIQNAGIAYCRTMQENYRMLKLAFETKLPFSLTSYQQIFLYLSTLPDTLFHVFPGCPLPKLRQTSNFRHLLSPTTYKHTDQFKLKKTTQQVNDATAQQTQLGKLATAIHISRYGTTFTLLLVAGLSNCVFFP